MASSVVRLLSLLLVALSLGLSLARLFELPNKINLCVEDYFTVQNIYRRWALLGFVVFGVFFLRCLQRYSRAADPRAAARAVDTHAAGAALNLTAMIGLILSLLGRDE